MTRVAQLNHDMWAELFLENDDNLLTEIDAIIKNLVEYRDAIAEKDRERLALLLREGSDKKREVDGH